MGEKLVIGPINKGLRNDRTAFVIDNDSFPTLINAYQWRGRVKRKRGTQFLCRLQRFLGTTDGSGNITVTILPTPIGTGISSFVIGTDIFMDPGGASPVTLITNGSGSGTLNRTTGVLTITRSIAATNVFYYPSLPVMGLEDFVIPTNAFPGTIAFDTTYSYTIQTPFPYQSYNVSFYKNPAASASLPGYVPKTTPTPTYWNGEDYQQFWTVNYQGALWATNGIDVPFTGANIGMQFNTITAVSIGAAGPPAIVTITTGTNHGLVVGDFVFLNEIVGMTGINLQSGYVTVVPAANQITVELPYATVGGAWSSGGIVQYLTNRSDPTKDCLRWYDGDPTNGSATNPAFVQGNGWVNFMPPLNNLPDFPNFSIADLPSAQYYLVGARLIIPFKDRLLFLGAVVQTSAANAAPIYLQDTVVYSQNGTPYYNSSFTGDVYAATTIFHPILAPVNQTATAPAYFEDATGFGGFITAGIDQPIITAAFNEDTIIVGFRTLKSRLTYTGNDLVPFNFFQITTEYGDVSTFSVITMDKGVITRGDKGFIITSQVDGQRFDLEIPDQVFEINATNNGNERFTAARDFINEWVYFTYPSNERTYIFPNQTLLYNYRDNSWAIFNESYTTYGSFRKQTGFTWATVGDVYESWDEWNDPWDAGESQLLQPDVIGGNQQGFVLIKDEGTGEGTSLVIQNIVGSTVTSPNHCLNVGDYIIITEVLGDVGNEVNGKIFSVQNTTTNTFDLNPNITSSTYLGGGLITRMYVPFIQTKQFPVAWDMARKTRLGPQQYLLTTTSNGQITLLIYLSQNANSPYNNPAFPSPVELVPLPGSLNNSLIYSTVLYTCPESTNLGLTFANVNLQMPTASQQAQIWHRMNTSLIGDTVQIGFTMSDDQMRALVPTIVTYAITGATQTNPCVLTCSSPIGPGQLVMVSGVVGMTELNGNIYQVVSSSSTTLDIGVDATAFNAYVSGGIVSIIDLPNQFSEIELHSAILDVQPSSLLA